MKHTLSVAELDRSGERLLETLASCDPKALFAARVEASLLRAFALLAEDPGLADLLDIDRCLLAGPPVEQAHSRWLRRYTKLLRDAARDCFGATELSPPFLEPLVVDGLCWMVSKRLRDEGLQSRSELLQEVRDCLLGYYPRATGTTGLSLIPAAAHAGRPPNKHDVGVDGDGDG